MAPKARINRAYPRKSKFRHAIIAWWESLRRTSSARPRSRTTPRRSTRSSERDASAVSTNALAERLGVTPARRRAWSSGCGELGLVEHQPYRGVSLTEAGRRVALEVIRHHRLLELYLARASDVPWDRVQPEAEVLEHVLSEELEELIAAKLGNPTHDPHGDPIPTRELTIEEGETESLDALRPGMPARSRASRTPIPRCCASSAEHGIAPGDSFEVVEKQPFDGPLFVRFGDERPGARRHTRAGDAGGGRPDDARAYPDPPSRRCRAPSAHGAAVALR